MIKYIRLSCMFFVIAQVQSNELEQINNVINLYKRPITFLGICDNADEMIQILVKKNPSSVFVLLNTQDINITDVPPNLIKLNVKIDANIIKRLGECEHFDLVYVNNHANCSSKIDYIKSLYHSGENVIVSMSNKEFDLIPLLKAYDFHEIGTSSSQASYFISTKSITYLKRNQWFEPSSQSNSVRYIESTYTKKILHKRHMPNSTPSSWLPGINLMTFKVLSGSIPNKCQLIKNISELFKIPHLDLMPNNMIVQGEKLVLIDFDPPGSEPKTVQTLEMLNLLYKFAECKTEDIIYYFNKILLYCKNQIHPSRSIAYKKWLLNPIKFTLKDIHYLR